MGQTEQRKNGAAAEDETLDEYIDQEVTEDLDERQQMDQVGREILQRRLREHTSESPKLTGGDVDAAWDLADTDEDVIAGQNPTPDQSVVDEIGEGAGLTYEDDEPLNYAKVSARDRNRWELNPASALDLEQDEAEDDDLGEDDDEEEDEDDLDDLGLLEDEGVETDALEVLDVDDLAEDVEEEEEEEAETVEDDELDDLDLDELDEDDDDDDDDDEDEDEL